MGAKHRLRFRRGRRDSDIAISILPWIERAANTVRLQLHALAYNLGNFLRTMATP
jgi:hypothetical protein